MTLFEAISATVARDPDRVAIVSPRGERTYGELAAEVDALSAGLLAAGVVAGDVVATSFPNDFETYVAIVALARIGAVNVPLWPDLSEQEEAIAIERPRAAHLLADAPRQPGGGAVALGYREVLERGRGRPVEADGSDEEAVFFLLETSGTTGGPKLVAFNQRRYMTANRAWLEATGLRADDVTLCIFPPSIGHGLLLCAGAFLAGGQVVLGEPSWTPAEILAALECHRVSVFSGLPLHYDLLCAAASERGGCRLPRLRLPFCGGAFLPRSTIDRADEVLGVRIRRLYGTTEFGVILANLEDRLQAESGMRSFEGVEVRLLGEDGEPVLRGALGEVVARGEGTSLGYHGDEAATAELFRDGWCRTGDLARQDADGRFWVSGRRSDAIATAEGYLFPAELETALAGVDGVREAVVLPLGDGEARALAAFVVADGSADEDRISELLDSAGLPAALHRWTEIPRLGSGKPDRARLLAEVGSAIR